MTLQCCAHLTGDRIELTGLAAYGYHGVFDSEKQLGQKFLVDIEAVVNLAPAAATDAVTETVHYGELAQLAHEIITGPSFDLIEKVAGAIASQALAQFPLIQAITVRLHKPGAPIPLPFADVAVVVHRHQP